MATTPTASVSQDSSALGRLRQKGLRVRTISTMASSVISDSTNQAVWKTCAVAPAMRSRKAKVDEVEQRADQAEAHHEAAHVADVPVARGRTCSASTLSVAIASDGMSDRKLLSRICGASSGRNGRNERGDGHGDHVAEIGAGGDGDVLHRVGEGPAAVVHAAQQDAQIALEQDHVGGLARHIHRAVDGNADVGLMQRRRIVDAVAEIADDMAALAQGLR